MISRSSSSGGNRHLEQVLPWTSAGSSATLVTDPARFLSTAPFGNVAAFPAAHTHPTYQVTLVGGGDVLVKSADALENGHAVVRREVAAAIVSEELGWPDLVPLTVLREVQSFTASANTSASVQVFWPNAEQNPSLRRLSGEDVWRAAVFDAVIYTTDRDHNWLGVRNTHGTLRLKLIDHGLDFEYPGRPFVSVFVDAKRGHEIPERIEGSLRRFRNRDSAARLLPLLSREEVGRLVVRVDRLLQTGTLLRP